MVNVTDHIFSFLVNFFLILTPKLPNLAINSENKTMRHLYTNTILIKIYMEFSQFLFLFFSLAGWKQNVLQFVNNNHLQNETISCILTFAVLYWFIWDFNHSPFLLNLCFAFYDHLAFFVSLRIKTFVGYCHPWCFHILALYIWSFHLACIWTVFL